ncbi:DUF4212 domain-containing protein [Ottowia sp.]|uniref:DUF4212 domain-containing protein n=1 Tax=Ottowia sp. TaxID=1898956 RepID=UPI003A887492
MSAVKPLDRRAAWVRAALLLAWAVTSFGVLFFARDLDQVVAGWPFNYWWAAQGGVLAFIAIGMVYAWCMNRLDPDALAHGAAGVHPCSDEGDA